MVGELTLWQSSHTHQVEIAQEVETMLDWASGDLGFQGDPAVVSFYLWASVSLLVK